MARNRDNSRNDAFDALDAFSSGKHPSEPAAPSPKPKPKPKPKPAPQPPAEAPQQAAKPRPKRPVAPAPSPAPQAPQPSPPAESSGRPATPPPVQPKARPVAARPAGQPARAVAAPPAPRQAAAQPVKKRSSAANAALRRKLAAAEKSETFRQTLIPILITVAVMLLVLCTIGLMAIPEEATIKEGDDHDGWDFSALWMLNKPWAKWVILAGYPVAVVLAFGAWMFVMQSGRYKSLLASVTKEKQDEADSA